MREKTGGMHRTSVAASACPDCRCRSQDFLDRSFSGPCLTFLRDDQPSAWLESEPSGDGALRISRRWRSAGTGR